MFRKLRSCFLSAQFSLSLWFSGAVRITSIIISSSLFLSNDPSACEPSSPWLCLLFHCKSDTFRLCEDLIWSLHPSPSSPSPHHGDSEMTVTAVPPPAALLCDFMLRHKNLLQLSPCYSSVVLEALDCATFRTADQKSPCVFACMLNQNVILLYEYSSMSYTTSLSWAVFNCRLS